MPDKIYSIANETHQTTSEVQLKFFNKVFLKIKSLKKKKKKKIDTRHLDEETLVLMRQDSPPGEESVID